jgi:hypothetical protein
MNGTIRLPSQDAPNNTPLVTFSAVPNSPHVASFKNNEITFSYQITSEKIRN